MSIIRETLIEETCKKCTETNCGMECFVYRQKCYVDEKKYTIMYNKNITNLYIPSTFTNS